MPRQPLCETYDFETYDYYNGAYVLDPYQTVVLSETFPRRYRSTDWEVFHGYSVAAGAGLAFFQHKDPAAAYAYAARQAFGSIDIREAAQLRATCPRHNDHEYVLLVNNIVDRDDEFLNAIQRFARGAERSWPSSTWWPPPA